MEMTMIERGFFCGATHVIQVEPGTKITDERTGQSEEVLKGIFVVRGNNIYCLADDYMVLLSHPDIANSAEVRPRNPFSI